MYNYLEAMKEDVLEYINNEINLSDYEDLDELEQFLNDELWIVDSVTGNASGSYTFNRFQAQEYVCDNIGELKEALDEFGTDAETIADKFLSEDWEYFDVIIRCYLLGAAISEVLEEIEEDFEAAHKEAQARKKAFSGVRFPGLLLPEKGLNT